MDNLIIIGAGGHAKVIADVAISNGYTILGFLDDNPNILNFLNFNRLGSVKDFPKFADKAKFIIAIGSNCVREKIANTHNANFATLIHPTAVIGSNVTIQDGTVVMPYAVINADTKIGSHCIINSSAVVEHDCDIGDFSHIAPNATLCGTVMVGKKCHIGAGATIINNIDICENCIIGAGAVVTKSINVSGTYVGVPAKVIK